MGLASKLEDSLVTMAIRKVIKKSNSKINFTELITINGSESDLQKKLVVRISDMEEVTGLGVQEGKLVEITAVDKPDTIFTMTKNTFTAILLNKLDHRQAYLFGIIEADGANWLRDSILLGKIFDNIKRVMKE